VSVHRALIASSACRDSIQAGTSAATRERVLAALRGRPSEEVRGGREMLLALLQLHSIPGACQSERIVAR